MDIIANASIDLMFSPSPAPEVVNFVHPYTVPWNFVFTSVKNTLGGDLPLVPYNEWLAKIDDAVVNASGDDFERIPGIKLQQFFHGFSAEALFDGGEAGGPPSFDTTVARRYSRTLEEVMPLDERQIALWIQYWRDQSFLA